jgi:hypothetical protein
MAEESEPRTGQPAAVEFEAIRRQADEKLAAGDAPAALALYRGFQERLRPGHPLIAEAGFHVALITEADLARPDEALEQFVTLATGGHDGAVKALARILEAALVPAREEPPAGEAIAAVERLLARLPPSVPGAPAAREWLEGSRAARRLAEGQDRYDRNEPAAAAEALEQAARAARAAGNPALERKAFSRAAAAHWYGSGDGPAALRVLADLARAGGAAAVLEAPPVRAILDRVVESLLEDLKSLIRRGDRREAFARMSAVRPLLPGDHPLTQDVLDVYLGQLASHHLGAVDERIGQVMRRLDSVSAGLVRRSMGGAADGSAGAVRDDPADTVADSLALFSLGEEREMLHALREALRARELDILARADADLYLAILEASRTDESVPRLLDSIHLVALERMHYRVKLKLPAKDALASLLPDSLSRYVVDETYQRMKRMELDVKARTQALLLKVYGSESPANTTSSTLSGG